VAVGRIGPRRPGLLSRAVALSSPTSGPRALSVSLPRVPENGDRSRSGGPGWVPQLEGGSGS